MQFNTRIREVRTQKGLTQCKLAEMVEISRAYLTQIESKRKQPSVITLIKLSKALDVLMSDLIC